MKYFFIIQLLTVYGSSVLAGIEEIETPSLNCPATITVKADPENCFAIVKEIDPGFEADDLNDIGYVLTGATSATGSGSASGQKFTTGTTTVQYFLKEDPAVQCSFTVVVEDKTAPRPLVPELPDLTAVCSITISNLPRAIDQCSGSLMARTDDPLSYDIPGMYTVEWKYEDDFGNISTQTQKVQVTRGNGKIQPIEKMLPDLINPCGINITDHPRAVSSCGNIIRAKTSSPLKYSQPGIFIITWVYYDGENDSLKQFQRVAINDQDKPVPDLALLPDLIGECSVTVQLKPTASDNCPGKITATTSSPLQYDAPGTYIINWKYTDPFGNFTHQEQKVIVTGGNNLIIPDKTSLPELTSNCSVTITEKPGAKFGCGRKLVGSTSDPLSYNVPGTYTLTWVYDNDLGDTVHQKQKIIIRDEEPPKPELKTLPDIIGECSVTMEEHPSAMDECNGRIKATTSDPLVYTKPGEYSITWIYTDESGNKTEQAQKIIVLEGKGKPVPQTKELPELRGECSITITQIPDAKSVCGNLIKGETKDPLSYTGPGNYTITWTYTDGNQVQTQEQKIVVSDKTAPVPAKDKLPDIITSCSVTITEVPMAMDDCNGPIEAVSADSLVYHSAGIRTIRWIYSDKAGNKTIQDQKVVVTAGDKPISPLVPNLPDLHGSCSVSITTKPKAATGCGQLITASTNDPLEYFSKGNYELKWKYEDGNGNELVQIQRIIILDLEPPVPELEKLPEITGECRVEIKAIPVAMDECEGPIKAQTKDPLNFDKPGEYSITWVYTDKAGNSSTQQQKLSVLPPKETPVPIVRELPGLESPCSITITDIPKARSACGETLEGKTGSPLKYDKPGNYDIVWTYTDKAGNRSTQNQKISISGNRAPVPEVKNLPEITASCAITVTDIPTAIDACGNLIKASSSEPLLYSKPGTYNIQWTYTDRFGNNTVQEQKLVVKSGDQPILPAIAILPDLKGNCSLIVTDKPTAKSGCGEKLIASSADPMQYSLPGEYQIKWIFKDGDGNKLEQVQKVIVHDEDAPVPVLAVLPELSDDCFVAVEASPTAMDECSGKITGTTSDPLVYTKAGSYIIHWSFVDKNGNKRIQEQRVLVRTPTIETSLPDLPALTGSCMVRINAGPEYNLPCGGTITATTSDPLEYGLGNHTITWTYKLNDGQQLVQKQPVIVRDTKAPVPTLFQLPDIVSTCAINNLESPTAMDDCGGIINGISMNPLIYDPGTYTIHWMYKDQAGNSTIQKQKLVITSLPLTVTVASNPAGREFQVQVKTCDRLTKIGMRVFDLNGRLLETRQVLPFENLRFGAGYASGIYLIQVVQKNEVVTQKLFKN